MATKKRLGLRISRPLHDPTGEKKAKYLMALNEGYLWWQDSLVVRAIVKNK